MVAMAVLGYYGNDIAIVVTPNYLWAAVCSRWRVSMTLSDQWARAQSAKSVQAGQPPSAPCEPMPGARAGQNFPNPFCASWMSMEAMPTVCGSEPRPGLPSVINLLPMQPDEGKHNVKNSKRI